MRDRLQWLALATGLVLLAVGALRLGESSALLDVVHLATGALGILLAARRRTAGAFLVGSGLAYLALWLLGTAAAGGWLSLDPGDNWLHFVLGMGSLSLAGAARRL